MRLTKKIIFLSVSIIAPTVSIIIVIELIFGNWIFKDPWFRTKQLNLVRNLEVSQEEIVSGERVIFKYTRNKYGLRDDCGDPSSIEILTIGGSTTDQRYVSDGDTYQDVLQNKLSSEIGREVCVSNAGVDGHSTFGHLASFKLWFPLIEDLRPKFVIFYVGINDAGFRRQPNLGYDTNRRPNESYTHYKLRENSILYDSLKVARTLITAKISNPIYARHGEQKSRVMYGAKKRSQGVEALVKDNTIGFGERMSSLVKEVKKLGATPICVSQPHLMTREINGKKIGVVNAFEYEKKFYNGLDYDYAIRSLNNQMKNICTKENGYFIDLTNRNYEVDDFYDLVHTTPQGSKRLGDLLFQEFLQQKIYGG